MKGLPTNFYGKSIVEIIEEAHREIQLISGLPKHIVGVHDNKSYAEIKVKMEQKIPKPFILFDKTPR